MRFSIPILIIFGQTSYKNVNYILKFGSHLLNMIVNIPYRAKIKNVKLMKSKDPSYGGFLPELFYGISYSTRKGAVASSDVDVQIMRYSLAARLPCACSFSGRAAL